MKNTIDQTLRANQAGFRAKRSTTDHIATLRLIIEQSIEWQSGLIINFMDLKRAFDSIHRDSIWKLLKIYGLPQKFIKLNKVFYDNYKVKVIHNNQTTEAVKIEAGVKQGCILSPTIFLVVIDWVMKKATATKRGIPWNVFHHLEDLDFADDISLLSQKVKDMQEKKAYAKKEKN